MASPPIFPCSTLHRSTLPLSGRACGGIVLLVAATAACRPEGDAAIGRAAARRVGPPSASVAGAGSGIRVVRTLYPLSAYSRLVGRPAPPLDIAHWLEAGEGGCKPFESFAPGRVYVVTFWASWCPRCREALPQLAALARGYEPGMVTVIGVSHEDPADVRKFLSSSDSSAAAREAARCCLTADPDESVHRNYMEAVDETGVPTAFLVGREGLIEWIGHPDDIEEPLADVVAGRWDREAFVARRRAIEAIRARMATVVEQAGGLDARAAVEALRTFIAECDGSAATLNEIGWLVVEFAEGKPLPAELLAAAVEGVERSLVINPDDPNTLDTLAHLQAMQGRIDAAIATQSRAVAIGGAEADRRADFLRELRSRR